MAAVATAKTTTCAKCGTALESASSPDLGCMVCMLQLASARSPAAFDRDLPLEQFSQYVIEKREDGRAWELGRGAMGVTYRATDSILQRTVALKIIGIDRAPDAAAARERFLREARAAAALRHPNIATVHQFGIHEESGQCFYAMELIEGETLEERVRRKGPCDVPMTIVIARQVADALLAAETRGLVHRDIKPGNLMMIDGGDETDFTIKVIDFGVAKALAATPGTRELTHGGFVGTPAFASPEQFTDAPVDVRSDIYSLGATLWYLLTAHLPFGDGAGGSAPPIEQLKAARVPPPFISLLVSMLAIEPAARPGVRELSAKLAVIAVQVGSRKKWALRFALVAIAAGASIVFLHRSPNEIAAPPQKSVAVLPFDDLSDDKTNAYFASGIHDDLLVNLSKIRDLKVISRDSVLPYKGSSRNLREIGKALGVNAVLEGSVRRAGARARINVQLIDTQKGEQIWAENYDRELVDAFGSQGDLAFQIASALKAKLSPGEAARLRQPPTQNGEAYLLYVQANDYFAGREKLRPDLEKAEQLYERAIQLDPSFALADAQLGRLECVFYSYHEPTSARHAKAEAAASEALRLQPDLPEAHVALAEIYWRTASVTNSYDYTAALREFEIARRGLPNDPDIYGALGRIRRHQGKWKEALADLEKAASLDPNTADRWHRLWGTYLYLRDYPAASAALDRAIALAPNTWQFALNRAFLELDRTGDLTALERLRAPTGTTPDDSQMEERFAVRKFLRKFDEAEALLRQDSRELVFWSGVRGVPKSFLFGELFFQAGKKAEASAAYAAALPALEKMAAQNVRDAYCAILLGQSLAGLGRETEARRECQRASESPETKSGWSGPSVQEGVAQAYAMLGAANDAMPILAHLLAVPCDVHRQELRFDPAWDSLRGDLRFQKLLEQPDHVLPLEAK